MSPRLINIALGIWLVMSAFAWSHSQAQMTNAWVCGGLCVIFALLGMSVRRVRFANTILAIWLFISAFALPKESAGTGWNDALVAAAIFVVSLAGTRLESLGGRVPIRPV